MDQPAETLACDLVTLRRFRPEDVDELDRVIVESLEHLKPWMPWAHTHSLDAARDYLDRAEREWGSGEAYNYAITTGGAILGSCSLMRRIGPGGLEIRYWIRPERTGRGLVTMAAAALTRQAFELPGTTHVEIHHDPANTASGAIPRRLGYAVVPPGPTGPPGPEASAEQTPSVVRRLDRVEDLRLR